MLSNIFFLNKRKAETAGRFSSFISENIFRLVHIRHVGWSQVTQFLWVSLVMLGRW